MSFIAFLDGKKWKIEKKIKSDERTRDILPRKTVAGNKDFLIITLANDTMLVLITNHLPPLHNMTELLLQHTDRYMNDNRNKRVNARVDD